MSVLKVDEIFGIGDEEVGSAQISPEEEAINKVGATITREAGETLKRWQSSGALTGKENPVILAKLAFKEAGEHIAMNPEMTSLWKNLKRF